MSFQPGTVRPAGQAIVTLIAAGIVAVLAFAMFTASAEATVFNVTRPDDPKPNGCKIGDCSLREAVIASNKTGGNRIRVPWRKGGYRLQRVSTGEDAALNGDIDITARVDISGTGNKGPVTIAAKGIDRHFDIFDQVHIRNLRLVGGRKPSGTDDGGAIRISAMKPGFYADATVFILDVVMSDNRATGNGGALAIAIEPTPGLEDVEVVLQRSKLSGNRASGAGGAISCMGSGVPGFGYCNVNVSTSKIRNNTADGAGGGAWVEGGIELGHSWVDANNAGGHGGGIAAGFAAVDKSAVTSNRSDGDGGGISGRINAVNSTFATNSAGGSGGGLSGEGRLVSTTVAFNVAADGGGLYSPPGLWFGGTSNLLAHNELSGGGRNDCAGEPFDSNGYNLVSVIGPPGGACSGFDATGDLVVANARIRRPSNDHPRLVIPNAGSPAVNASVSGHTRRNDQTGYRRDSKPDIGAYEYR